MTAAAPMFLTLKQAAAVTGVSADTLSRNIHAGTLRAKKTAATGGKTLVRIEDLSAWFDQLDDA